jgi:hypothetical protein
VDIEAATPKVVTKDGVFATKNLKRSPRGEDFATLWKISRSVPANIKAYVSARIIPGRSPTIGADVLTAKDYDTLIDLMNGRRASGDAGYAQLYFSRYPDPTNVLGVIAFDIEAGPAEYTAPKEKGEKVSLPAGEIEFFNGTGRTAAEGAQRWVDANLSKQAGAKIRELQEKTKTETRNVQLYSKLRKVEEGAKETGKPVQGRGAVVPKVVTRKRAAEQPSAAVSVPVDAYLNDPNNAENLAEIQAKMAKDAEGAAEASLGKKGRTDTLADAVDELGETDTYFDEGVTDFINAIKPPDAFSSRGATPDNEPLHPDVVDALSMGDLERAIRLLVMTSSNPHVRKYARKLVSKVGRTRVYIVDRTMMNRLVQLDSEGRPATGAFIPTVSATRFATMAPATQKAMEQLANSIVLADDTGLSSHTLLHEITHAVTVAELSNPSNPMTIKLKNLYELVGPRLKGRYDTPTLAEFVAEMMSNQQLRREMQKLTIMTDGKPVSGLAKFSNAVINYVRNLLGMPRKDFFDPQTTLSESDKWVNSLLAPFPDSFDGDILPSRVTSAGAKLQRTFVRASDRGFKQRFKDQARHMFSQGIWRNAKVLTMQLLDMQAAVDVAKTYKVERADEMYRTVMELEAAVYKAYLEVEGTAEVLKTYIKNSTTEQVALFNAVVHDSTVIGKDPTTPDDEAKKRWKVGSKATSETSQFYDTTDYTDWEEWLDIKEAYDKLDPAGKRMYKQLRDAYKTQFEALKDVIKARVDAHVTDPALATSLKAQLLARLTDNMLEPYFPLARRGDYWLEFTSTDGEPVYMAFETKPARDDAMREFATEEYADKVTAGTIKEFDKLYKKDSFESAPSDSIISKSLQILDDAEVPAIVKEDFMKLFVEAMPESVVARAMHKRGGYLGFEYDALFALQNNGHRLAGQIQRFKYGAKIAQIETEMATARRGVVGADEMKGVVLQSFIDRGKFARNPPENSLARNLNRFGFMWTIGLNPSSALVNLSQIPVVMYPYLSAKFGAKDAYGAMQLASKLFMTSGLSRNIRTGIPGKDIDVNASPSIDNYFTYDAKGKFFVKEADALGLDTSKPEDAKKYAAITRLSPIVEAASKQGLLNRSLTQEQMGLEGSGRGNTLMDKISAIFAFQFHHVERFNRQIALISSFELELRRLEAVTGPDKLNAEERGIKAAAYALHTAQEINGGASLATTIPLAQSGLGRVAMMFKSFGFKMYYLQFKLIKDAIDFRQDLTKEERVIARNQLFGMTLSSALLAGVHGTTLYGIAAGLANLFLLDDEEEDADMITRRYLSEAVFKGLPSMLLGVDLSARIGLSDLILRGNPYMDDASIQEQAVALFGGPSVSSLLNIHRGVEMMLEGDIYRGFEATLPTLLRNVSKAGRFLADDGVLTRREDEIYGDVSIGDAVGQAIGFAPIDLAVIQETNQNLKRIDLAVQNRRSKLMKQYYVASRVGDSAGMMDAYEEIQKFNTRHSDKPGVVITNAVLKRSLKSHERTSASMRNGVTLSKSMRASLDELAAADDWGNWD